jgi:NAD(P)-dependent dehydrogenase (short-subunit alcohol dehydrogenase family)
VLFMLDRNTAHDSCNVASMFNSPRSLADQVVVITGASSGIGRAAAVEFARRGAHVVLAARRADALEESVALCHEVGGRAVSVVTDVTVESDVLGLLERALQLTGVIHTWVNNAGVTAFGALEATPVDIHRRVIETNVWGSIFGARAVLPVFRRQGHGVLINVGSILSKVGQPFVPSYVISKFAVRGLSEALRAEVADQPRIHVCSLLPYAVDTPHFQAGANLVGRKAHAMTPVQSPKVVAEALVDLSERPQRERHVPRSAVLGLALHALFPRPIEKAIHEVLSEWHFGQLQAPDVDGNLWRPPDEQATVEGRRKPRAGLTRIAAWFIRRRLAHVTAALNEPRHEPA